MGKVIENIVIYIIAILNPRSLVFLVSKRLEIEETIIKSNELAAKSQESYKKLLGEWKILEEEG